MSRRSSVDWAAYLAAFRAERPGVTERVLSRTLSGGHTPYRWLARAISPRAATIVDIACGTGAMSRELARPGRTVVGFSLSPHELGEAARRSPGPWACASGLRMPLADESVDAVVSVMGTVVIQPTGRLFAEVSRVLKPGGVFAFMAPTVVPLRPSDVATSLGVVGRLRALPRFPGPTEMTGYVSALVGTGLRKVEDARERYHFTVHDPVDAVDVISALYLPTTSVDRTQRAVDYLVDTAIRRGEARISIAMRRFVTIKNGSSSPLA